MLLQSTINQNAAYILFMFMQAVNYSSDLSNMLNKKQSAKSSIVNGYTHNQNYIK